MTQGWTALKRFRTFPAREAVEAASRTRFKAREKSLMVLGEEEMNRFTVIETEAYRSNLWVWDSRVLNVA